ncbi:MAG: peptidyl-prolyl cis-trans isomerase [Acidobacteriota bacterium]
MTRRGVRPFLVVFGLATASAVARAEVIEQVLVKVNGEAFTKTDLEARQVARIRELQGQKIDIKSGINDAQLRKTLDEITPQVVVDAVDDLLVVQRGKELGYKLNDDQFKTFVDNIRKENKLEAEETFQAALKQEGLTTADLRRNLERQMIWQRVQQNEVMGKIAMSEDEARAYYDSHLKEFSTPATVTVREILVAVPADTKGVNVAADDAAKARAEAIRARATAGDSFEKLASDMSDAPTRTNAGLIGPISLTDLSNEVRAIIEAMKPGDITAPLRTARGYQILKLETMTGNQVQPFEQARDQISSRVLTDKRRQEFGKYLDKLRTQAIIDWKNAEVQKAYTEGLKRSVPAASPSH